jgi:hypothetical protein
LLAMFDEEFTSNTHNNDGANLQCHAVKK